MVWNEQTVEKFSYLKWPKIFINAEFRNEVICMDPLFPKHWTVLNFKVLTSTVQRSASGVQCREFSVQGSESSIQSPMSRVQRPGSSVQSPASRVQCPESSVQSQASNSCVQSPGIPVCLNNENSGKNSLNSFTAEVWNMNLITLFVSTVLNLSNL